MNILQNFYWTLNRKFIFVYFDSSLLVHHTVQLPAPLTEEVMEQILTYVKPLKDFSKDSMRLVKRCTKPDLKGKLSQLLNKQHV